MLNRSVLVVGADSPIGKNLASRLRQSGLKVSETTRRLGTAGDNRYFLDLATLDGVESLPICDWTAIVASETRFAECDRDPELTGRINRDGPIEIGRRALAQGSQVFFFSSIAVHDGETENASESMEPSPNSVYGRQKREAEIGLLEQSPNVVILRPSKIIIPGFALFAGWRRDLRAGKIITPFNDMYVAPVWIDTLIDACIALMARPEVCGIYQYSAQKQLSYAEIAAQLMTLEKIKDSNLLAPCSALERLAVKTAWMPPFATLSSERLREATGMEAPAPEDAIELFYRSAENDKI